MNKFKDRVDGGKKLAEKLEKFKDKKDIIVLGLPRGGVITANEVAKSLHLPLDIVVPRKIGAPFQEELAIGAITEDGEPILNQIIINSLNITDEHIENQIKKEKKEAKRRIEKYRGDRPNLNLTNKTVILIDDGIATGSTMLAAISSTKAKGAKKIVVATPTIAPDTLKKIRKEVDEVIYIIKPLYFDAVGQFYENFEQTNDEEVVKIMR